MFSFNRYCLFVGVLLSVVVEKYCARQPWQQDITIRSPVINGAENMSDLIISIFLHSPGVNRTSVTTPARLKKKAFGYATAVRPRATIVWTKVPEIRCCLETAAKKESWLSDTWTYDIYFSGGCSVIFPSLFYRSWWTIPAFWRFTSIISCYSTVYRGSYRQLTKYRLPSTN